MTSYHVSVCARLLTGVFLTIIFCGTALGQAAARPDRGLMPTGSYSVSDIENVSLTNGNLNIGIPLASLPPIAGGRLGLNLRAEYNSKLWDTVRSEHQSDPANSDTKFTYVVSNLQLSDKGGWRVGAGYSISFESVAADYQFLPPAGNDPEYNLITGNYWTKVVLTSPDGATHELRPLDYSSYGDGYFNHSYLRGYFKDTPHTVNGPVRYYSFDGSHLWAKIDPTEYCCFGPAQSWTLYLPDGTKVEQLINGDQRITDTNGNKVKIFATETSGVFTQHYQDEQTGREIKVTYDPSGNGGQGSSQVQYQTVNGVWEAVVINYGATHVFGKRYEFGNPECAESADYIDTWMTVIRSIVYPQTEPGQAGRQFIFTYNSDTTDTVNYQWRPNCWVPYETVTAASHGWGSLSQMGMPTGATVNYAYSLDGTHYLAFNPDNAPREGLGTKTLIHDGTSDTWTYFVNPGEGGFTAPDGSSVVETRYSSDPGFAHTYSGFGGKEELVYRTNTSNKMMVERHWTLMRFTGGDNITAGPNVLVAFNPVVDAEYTSLLENGVAVKMSAKTYQFDYNGNGIGETDYDWFEPALVSRDAQGVPTGVPASATVLRVVNNSYYNQATSAGSGNVYAKRSLSAATPLVLNALQQTTVGPSIVQLSYDGQGYGVAPFAGNLTSKSVWDNAGNQWITTSSTYGLYGNLATTTDARGKVTQFFYDDATHALPNRVAVDPENGTGTQTTTTAYDFSTGLVTRVTDANGALSEIDYTNQLLGSVDPFGRSGLTIGPLVNVGGVNQRQRTKVFYEDNARTVTVMSDLSTEGDGLLKSQVVSDMLGRTIENRQYETASAFVAVRRSYDIPNRISKTSNPFRADEAMLWTITVTDLLGRVVSATTPDKAVVTMAYNANETTVTDQAGKVRRSKVDTLGRLVRVDEPDAANNLGSQDSPTQGTSYQYDVLGNLTFVTQGTQTRSFSYTSLSRLREATNPEGGTISYEYDENGNVTKKIDPRFLPLPNTSTHVTINYAYDALDRVISRTYNDGTPNVTYSYDAGNVLNSKGRLTSVSSSTSSYAYLEYDVLGRVKTGTQTTSGRAYSMSYQYDLAGNIISQTYPSGRVVKTNYDEAGRIAGVKNNATGSYYAGAASTDVANRIQYSAAGAVQSMKLGNGLWEHRNFNLRLQPTQIGLGSASTNSTVLQLDYNYGTTNNNGNVQSQTITVPTVAGVTGFTATQIYTYDSLNRLATAHENNGSSWKQNFDYDRFGNRKLISGTTLPGSLTAANNPTINPVNNRIDNTVAGQGNILYDNAGNLTRDIGGRTYQYDAENKMVSADGGATSSGGAGYSYDANGQRVKKVVGGAVPTTTVFVYDINGQLVAEYADSGSTGAGISYISSDTLGSPRVVTGTSGQVKGRHDYLPFGDELFAGTGSRTPQQNFGADNIRQKFTGYERDSETNLDYAKARYYSHELGRFTSSDPLLASGRPNKPQSWNRYAYVLNNPLRSVDPNGLADRPIEDDPQQTHKRRPLRPAKTAEPATTQPQPSPGPTKWVYAQVHPTEMEREIAQKRAGEEKEKKRDAFEACINSAETTYGTEVSEITGTPWQYVKGTWKAALPQDREEVAQTAAVDVFFALVTGGNPLSVAADAAWRAGKRHYQTLNKLDEAGRRHQKEKARCWNENPEGGWLSEQARLRSWK